MTFALGLCDSELQAVQCVGPVLGDVTMDRVQMRRFILIYLTIIAGLNTALP